MPSKLTDSERDELLLSWQVRQLVAETAAAEREACARLLEAAAARFPESPQVRAVLLATAEDVRERGVS